MLIFIPSDDYSESASAATSITSLDYLFISAGHLETKSLRIGNMSTETIGYSLTTRHASAADVTIDLDSGTLQPDQISDTTSITVEVPPDAENMGQVFDIVAVVGAIEYELEVNYEAVGANDARRPQYPDRASSFTDQASNNLDRFSEWLTLATYQPITFDPSDTALFIRDGKLKAQSKVCNRLDPTNDRWGYTLATSTMRGSFVDESRDISTNLDQGLRYETSAYLVFSADQELIREWRLLAPARASDPDQYKRTVFVIERQGELYAIENAIPYFMGQILSHYEADLVSISRKDQNISSRYNPWAISYRLESDKPTHAWQCHFDADTVLEDIGSNSSIGSNLLGSDVS